MRTRDKPVLIYLSAEELAKLDKMASKASLSRSAFVRKFINDVQLKEAPPVDYYRLIREVRKVGSNIHQLLVLANSKGLIITNDLRTSLDEIYTIEELIRKSFSGD